jgi:hypothetical protein
MHEVISIADGSNLEKEPRTVLETGSEIAEKERIPTKEEVEDLIFDLARKEGLEVRFLQLDIESRDDKGNLLSLVFKVLPARAKSEGWTGINYEYYLAGKSNVGDTPDTEILRLNYKGEPPIPVAAGIIGKYIRGQWYLEPGKYNPTAKSIDPE